MKIELLILLLIAGNALAAEETLETIDVHGTQDLSVTRPVWEETDKTKILTGKKNRSSKINYLPPVQTDNHRQHFSQQPGIYAADLATEPWTSLSFRNIGDPHEGQNLLILQDGLPVAVDMYGQPGNYYSPPAPLMDSLNVIAGGGALMYGPQPGGSINYISPKLSKDMDTTGKLNAAYGSYDLFSTVNTVMGSQGNTSYYGGYYRKQGKGFMKENSDFSADYVQLKTNTFLENNAIFKSSLHVYDSDFGMAGGQAKAEGGNNNTWTGSNRTATRKYDRLRIGRAQLMLGVEKKLSEDTSLDAQLWSTAYKRYNKTQSGGGFGTFPTADTNTINDIRVYGFNGEVRVRHKTMSAGYLSYNSNSPTHAQAGKDAASNHGDTVSRSDRTTRVNALFAENKFTIGKAAVVPGLRYENITLTNENRTTDLKRADTYNVLVGGIGASYYLSEETQAFANVSQGFKPIGYGDVLNQANPTYIVEGDIKPSYNYFYEVGVRGENQKYLWDTSLYLIQRQNLIVTTQQGPNTILSNGSSAQYRGIESAFTWKNALQKEGHALDLYVNSNFNNAQFHGGPTKGKTPAYVPSFLLKYGAIYKKSDKLHASLLATWVNEHYANDAHSDNFKIPSYSVVDLLFEYNFNKEWSANGAINNILDEEYYARIQATGIQPTMKRNFYAGLNYRF